MSLLRKTAGLASVCLIASCGSPQMSPEHTAELPYVDVPFAKSELLLRQGTFDEQSGGCLFDAEFTAEPGELSAGQSKIRVQRSIDLENCVEKVEQGVVDVPEQKLFGFSQDSETVYAGTSDSDGLIPDPVDSLDATYTAEAQVTYFDRESVFAGLMAPLFVNGNDVSHVYSSVEFNTANGDCYITGTSAAISFSVFYSFITGWSESQNQLIRHVDCDKAVAEARVVHENNLDLPLLLSCGDGVQLRYQPFRLTVYRSGSRRLSGSYVVSGDKSGCSSYLTRVQSIS